MLSRVTTALQALRSTDSLTTCCPCSSFEKKHHHHDNYAYAPAKDSPLSPPRSRSDRRAASDAKPPGDGRRRRSASAKKYSPVPNTTDIPDGRSSDRKRKKTSSESETRAPAEARKGCGGGGNGSEGNGSGSPSSATTPAAATAPMSSRGERKGAQHAAGKENQALQGLWLEQQVRVNKDILITDLSHSTTYRRGRFLGKGGFAKCYKLTDERTHAVYAGKIISQNRILKPREREKMLREVELHRSLKHENVVGFLSFFENRDNVYIVLEYCSLKSLDDVIKTRRTITEPEMRYYVRQLVEGCRYVHAQLIIHRDLKLANMLLNAHMQLKIADFGLATRVAYVGEKKMTVCGTPNYIAPEVLQQKGHSYEADVWALGCIIYAMLVGRPPFETSSLKETYLRITTNSFTIPTPLVSRPVAALIRTLLRPRPGDRPTLAALVAPEGPLSAGFTPATLAPACCNVAPKFCSADAAAAVQPKPKSARSGHVVAPSRGEERKPSPAQPLVPSRDCTESSSSEEVSESMDASSAPSVVQINTSLDQKYFNLDSIVSAVFLRHVLVDCLENMPQDPVPCPVADHSPLCVTKWVDYSNKYGFGFELSDGTVGILFNDRTRMKLTGRTIHLIDADNRALQFLADHCPEEHKKKVALMLYFAEYMDNNLIGHASVVNGDTNDSVASKASSQADSTVFIKSCFRTSRAIVMCLSVGTLQVNFFDDHTKLIFSGSSSIDDVCDTYVTYIDDRRHAVTYNLAQLRRCGSSSALTTRLQYVRKLLNKLIISARNDSS